VATAESAERKAERIGARKPMTMKTKKTKRTAKARADSLQRLVRRRKEQMALEALVALALRPELMKPPTDAEIEKWMKEYDEGKHPLSKEGKEALDRADKRFRQQLREHIAKTGNDIYGRNAELALANWMQDVTSLLCYQPEVPHAHKESLVAALDRYTKARAAKSPNAELSEPARENQKP
jgi:hypothetical protein